MAEFERIEKVSYLRIFTHNINKRKFMISCCASVHDPKDTRIANDMAAMSCFFFVFCLFIYPAKIFDVLFLCK